MRLFFAALCVSLLSFCAFATPNKPVVVHLVTASWEGFANPDETGYYFDLLRRVFPSPEWQVDVQFMPFARTLYLIESGRVDMVLSVYKGDVKNSLLSENAVELDSIDAAVTPQIAATWAGMESLSHKRVQAMLAYRYNMLTSIPMFYEESSDMLSMLNSVNAGRIDAVLDYKKNMEALIPKLRAPQTFVIIQGVLNAETFFAFANTEKGQMLKQHFDIEHKKIIDSGEQDRLYTETKAKGF
ncbi:MULTISPECIES: transporter substrate-binding domain-containing protein [Shewanella]|uniref:transporter substrate-binding domain-containing protein n=1 Tax=Shewanella TaxID=22 RepID=UPI0006DB1CE1|nr:MULTISPECIES: transporter substrate-binding domain-containing protein [Shewanella]KPN76102.1 ABC transporter substrate-binding protein [Shewanella sp. Sh95]MCD8551152.1 transporter substrate-binding domain-containing protein [Shewanella xiamenensis]MCD8559876.1 transporter substrate-binding domain-containing protein [Shewanella xiamenensis]MCL1071075.1 transporter substrate-binding domain-containing protein [Shewanella xiamenensis]MCR4533241.1 transporter substrate-binding domain-containing